MKQKLVTGIVIIFCLGVLVLAARWTPSDAGKGKIKVGQPAIGVVKVEGVLMSSGGTYGGTAGTADIMQALQEARKREDIKAVLLRIDSPGGSAVAAQEVGEEIDRVRAAGKPVVASMGDVAASGGYWIAASCDEIYANPATTTGSIGVITELLNVQGLFEKLGIRSEVIKSGPYKDMGSMNREITPEERQILEDLVGDVYQQFLEQVETGRKGKIKPEEVRALADGRVMTGKQAQKSGLVDTMGNYYDALDRARELAHIEGEPQVVELNSADPLTRLLSRFSASSLVNNNTRVPMAY
ncbi:MAG: signal peptide peptidase SppA [Syntrophomonadaceae bacterium]|nr:signal peptide peptidase SppA [Syntrophomonadaceae bacterium]